MDVVLLVIAALAMPVVLVGIQSYILSETLRTTDWEEVGQQWKRMDKSWRGEKDD
jgi:hypothetical protein